MVDPIRNQTSIKQINSLIKQYYFNHYRIILFLTRPTGSECYEPTLLNHELPAFYYYSNVAYYESSKWTLNCDLPVDIYHLDLAIKL